jgi:predicted RNA-binding protein with RPS1 domain
LIHISELSDQLVKDPNDIVKQGEKVKVKILSISSTERHLGLSLKAVNSSAKVQKKKEPEKELSKDELKEAVEEAVEEEISKES